MSGDNEDNERREFEVGQKNIKRREQGDYSAPHYIRSKSISLGVCFTPCHRDTPYPLARNPKIGKKATLKSTLF